MMHGSENVEIIVYCIIRSDTM